MAKPKLGHRTIDSYTVKLIGVTICAGDCVLMRPSESSKPSYVARVEQIEADGGGGNVRVKVRWYYRPEETIGGRRQFHGLKKMFRTLDLFEAISDLWPEIESTFSHESVAVVRIEAEAEMGRRSDRVGDGEAAAEMGWRSFRARIFLIFFIVIFPRFNMMRSFKPHLCNYVVLYVFLMNFLQFAVFFQFCSALRNNPANLSR